MITKEGKYTHIQYEDDKKKYMHVFTYLKLQM